MKPIYDMWLVQIEVTNACTNRCANCTRMMGHHRRNYFMDIETVEKAIDSLDGFKGGIGIMGGEPTLHPEFKEICELLQKKVPLHKCGLWTSGYKWDEYKNLIKDTFKLGVFYNDHSDSTQKHQPVLVGIDEVIDDKELMWNLIKKCWIQEQWSSSINTKGAFFCEVAAALDIVFEGPGGYPIEKNWWNKTPEEFQDQVRRYCVRCGGALPLERPSNQEANDLISKKNYEMLLTLGSPKVLSGRFEIFDEKMDEEVLRLQKKWSPWDYLGGSRRKKDLKLDEIWLNKGFHGIRRLYYNVKGKFGGK